MNNLINLDSKFVMQTYGRFPVAVQKGENATLWDFEGKKYTDFTSGIGVCSIGHANPLWVKAITEQAMTLGHISNLFYSGPYITLAARLCGLTGMDKAFFSNSGAEANEGAIKLARKYSFDKYGSGRSTIITLVNSFHGRTITTLAATGQDKFHNYFFPFTDGFRFAEANSLDSLIETAGDDVCAVMVEPVQGEGGVLPLDVDYLKAVQKLCEERDWLFIIDEVQTGIGRLGSLFAFMGMDIKADIVTFAKGIGGGLPLGGFLANAHCSGVLHPGDHATTFGGNPICCAGAHVVLDVLNEKFLDEVKAKGEYIRTRIMDMKLPSVTGIRGAGLMIGVALDGLKPKDMAEKLIEGGLLCLTAGADALRFLPPLTITMKELDDGLEIFEKVMKEAV